MNPLKILVAEDGIANRKLLAELLTTWGHDATVVEDGRPAVEAAEANSFDLVLMDVEMPEMDGMEAARQIRRLEKASNIPPTPIIALTGHTMDEDRDRCLSAGIDAIVSKPICSQSLAETIKTVVAGGEQEQSSGQNDSDSDGIDLAAALDALGGDDELLRIVSAAFLDESPRLLDELHAAFAARDVDHVRRAAHAIKGSVRYYGDTPAFRLAYEIENKAAGNEIDNVRSAVSQIEGEIRRVRAALQSIVGENGHSCE